MSARVQEEESLPFCDESLQHSSSSSSSSCYSSSSRWRATRSSAPVVAVVLSLSGVGLVAEVSRRARRWRSQASKPIASANVAAVVVEEEVSFCSGTTENCLHTHCCFDGGKKGFQCYQKDDFWANCFEECVENGKDLLADGWLCTELGPRSKPGCEGIVEQEICDSDNSCSWNDGSSGGSCLDLCNMSTEETTCSVKTTCKWRGECSLSCSAHKAEGECETNEDTEGLCAWRKGECRDACYTFRSMDDCFDDGCSWTPSGCKVACSSFSKGTCSDQSYCAWSDANDRCIENCESVTREDACVLHEGKCIWKAREQSCSVDKCSSPWENCMDTECCSTARGASGMSCFAVNDTYASCRPSCAGSDHDGTKGWQCTQIGSASRYPLGCAWSGASCEMDHMCCTAGDKCIVKDQWWTACTRPEEAYTWDGTVLGGTRGAYELMPAAEADEASGASLYCFTVVPPDKWSKHMLKLTMHNRAGIFLCDSVDVFEMTEDEAVLDRPFVAMWNDRVRASGKYLLFDWTVKVDLNVLFLPDRLRTRIETVRPQALRAMYLTSSQDRPQPFLGEDFKVMSRGGVQMLLDHIIGCNENLLEEAEDGFLQQCWALLGGGYMIDPMLYRAADGAQACSKSDVVAFGSLNEVSEWQCCNDLTIGLPHEFDEDGVCQLGYVVDFNPTDPPIMGA